MRGGNSRAEPLTEAAVLELRACRTADLFRGEAKGETAMNKALVGLLIVLFVAVCMAADEPAPTRSPQALEILQKVDQTIKAVSAVRYKVKSTPTGVATNFVAPGEGSVVLVGWNGQMPEKFLIQAKGQREGKPVDVTGGGDGEGFYLIDHAGKKAYQDIDPAVMGSSRSTLFVLAMFEFVHDAPFDDELKADTVELVGTADVAGVECNEIRVVYAGGQGETHWFFAKSDSLPRRRVQKFTSPQGEGAIERTIVDLEVDPQLPEGLFAFKLPEGYQKIDDFAP